jgi:hypothetical protein
MGPEDNASLLTDRNLDAGRGKEAAAARPYFLALRPAGEPGLGAFFPARWRARWGEVGPWAVPACSGALAQ